MDNHKHHRRNTRPLLGVAMAGLFATALPVSAQIVDYNSPLAGYKSDRAAGIENGNGVFVGISAKASVNRAIRKNEVVDQQALVQPDGTLKLPDNQQNLVIRSTYSDVQRAADGTVRVASPTIQGNVTGNVTLFVDGQGIKNVTVINNPQ